MAKKRPYPTARDAGTSFKLALKVGSHIIKGDTVPEFLCRILRFIDESNVLENLSVPFYTSGQNFLLAVSPEHEDGRPFSAFRCFEAKDRTTIIYVNTNHPRFFALRQGARLLDAVGFPTAYAT